MASFKDMNGRTWTVEITVGSMRRVNTLIGVNLFKMHEPRVPGGIVLFDEIFNDALLLVDIVFALVKPQADRVNVSDEQFGESLGPEGLRGATEALRESLSFFYQTFGKPDLVAALKKQKELANEMALAQAKEIELTKLTSGDSASNSPSSPESPTPTPTPSENSSGPSTPSGATHGITPPESSLPPTTPAAT